MAVAAMPKIRTWDSGRIKKAAVVPRTATGVAKSGAQYAAQRAGGARKAGESLHSAGAPEEAAANFLTDTLTDAERRVVLAPARMGYRLSKWGLRKYMQHRRTAKARAVVRTAPPLETSSLQGPQQGTPGRAMFQAPTVHGHANSPSINGSSGSAFAAQGRSAMPFAGGTRSVFEPATGNRTASMTLRSAKPKVKGQIRPVKQPAGKIKLARSAKAAVKAGRAQKAAAKAAVKRSAAAAKATKTAAQKTQKAAVKTVKLTVKIVRTMIRLALAALRSLVMLLTGASVPVILVLVFVCAVAILLGSVFGIFFSGGRDSTALRAVVQEINQGYQERIEAIQAETDHQELLMTGSRATWPEILSVYSVLVVTDAENPQEVVTVTPEKQTVLERLFWQMNVLTSSTFHKQEGDKRVVILRIEVHSKTAWEMADLLGFDEKQREQLAALLDEGNRSLWREVLYGIGTGNREIVAVAMSQIGNVGGEPYWSWYGFSYRVEWCACFVSWCADQCGYIEAGVIPKFAGVGTGEDWLKVRGLWQDRHYEPSPGDIIFFDWNRDGNADHVGIVERVEDGWVYTVEGNSNDTCRERRYALGHGQIYGYGTPEYTP